MLLESIEQSPKSLLEFMLSNVERDALLQRLVNQFSSQSLQQMMSLLSATPGSLAQYLRMQLETRLRVNDSVELPTAETLLPAAPQQNVRIDGAEQGEWDETSTIWAEIKRLRIKSGELESSASTYTTAELNALDANDDSKWAKL